MDKLYYLNEFLQEQGIEKGDVCIVGSFAMEVAGLREAGDVDVVIKKSVRLRKGFDFYSATKVNEVVEVVACGWANFDKITDDELISDPVLTDEIDGFRIVNLSMLRRKKKELSRPKDIADMALIDGDDYVPIKSNRFFSLTIKSLLRRAMNLVLGRLKRSVRVSRVRNWVRRLRHGYWLTPLMSGRYELAISPENLISAEYIDGEFARYDTIVRVLAVEAYYGKNDYGFELYNKMQAARGAPEGYEGRFRELIQNVEDNSFEWKSVLEITRDGYLCDGSHRLALAIFHKVPVLTTRIVWSQLGAVQYGLNWFRGQSFTGKECALLQSRKEQLFGDLGLYFSLVLWPPVADFFDEIEDEMSLRVVDSTDYIYNDAEFEHAVRSIYEMDDIAEWKVAKKLAHMAPYEKKIRVLWVEFEDPEYRKKDLNNTDLSRVGEGLKSRIRGQYRDEVPNYIYDIICHTSDNWEHNRKMKKIFDR